MTPLKLAEIEAEKRYPLPKHSNPMLNEIIRYERAAFIAGAEWVKEQVVLECRDELLKQLHDMVHVNGYPCEAVPKATILSLPALMQLGYKISNP